MACAVAVAPRVWLTTVVDVLLLLLLLLLLSPWSQDRNRDDDVSGGRVSPVDPANNRFARVAASAPREADFERPRNEEAFASFAYPRRRDDEYVVGCSVCAGLHVCSCHCWS